MHVFGKLPLRQAALGAAVLLSQSAGAAAQDAPSNKLEVWTGHWTRHGEVKETQFSHARTFDYDVQCALLPHGAFMACTSISLMPDPNHGNRISNDVRVFYYNTSDKTFKYTEILPEEGPREGVVLVDGNVWTEPLEVPSRTGGTANARFIYNFVSPDRILARFEISTDKGVHWTEVDEFVDTKVN